MNDDIRAAHQFRMPRHSSVTKSALTENQNPLLPDWFNKWKATASPSPAAKADNMPRIITKDLRLDAITATSDTASTAIIKKSSRFADKLSQLEAEVTKMEAKVRALYPSDEDWSGDDYDPTLEDDDSADDDDEDEDDTDVQKLGPHKFEALVDHVADRDNIDRTAAAARARVEYPDVYRSYQRSGVAKRAPSYSELVKREERRGCSPTVAAQRVAVLYPEVAKAAQSEAINKGSVSNFMTCVDQIMARDDCSRVEALTKARLEHGREFRKYQNVT